MTRSKKSLKILFIADPLGSFDPVAETTTYLMKEGQKRGHQIYHTEARYLSARGTRVSAKVNPITLIKKSNKNSFKSKPKIERALEYFDAVLLRKDPPFDTDYLHYLYLLELASNDTYMMNHPSGILLGNEKLLPLPYQDRCPDTLISADRDALLGFLKEHPQGVILKPIGEAGGRGIFLLTGPKWTNRNVILDQATQGFHRQVIAQAYLKAGQKGDKRIVLLGQKILGAFVRIPAKGEHRANLHAGGKAVFAKISKQDQELVELLRPSLERLGLDFVGLDIIDKQLIEVNVTSPMGIHEINQTTKQHCERQVIDFIEQRTGARG